MTERERVGLHQVWLAPGPARGEAGSPGKVLPGAESLDLLCGVVTDHCPLLAPAGDLVDRGGQENS